MRRPRLPEHLRPERKLTAATGTSVAGAPIVAWIANGIFDLGMPEIVAAEIAILIGGGIGWLVRNR